LVCLLDRAYQFTVEVKTSPDENYTQVVDRSTNTTPGTVAEPITDNFAVTPARYVKITVAGAGDYSGDWCSILEFRVFGFLKSSYTLDKASNTSTDITIYPNPASTSLTINNNSDIEENFHVEIYTLTGNKIYESTERIIWPHEVDLSSLHSGNYLIKIFNGEKSFTEKFVKK
jgi:hypothetical protein